MPRVWDHGPKGAGNLSVDWSQMIWLVFRIRFEGQQNQYMTASLPTDARLPIEDSHRMMLENGVLAKRVEQLYGSLTPLRGKNWEIVDYVTMDDSQHAMMFPKENAEVKAKTQGD